MLRNAAWSSPSVAAAHHDGTKCEKNEILRQILLSSTYHRLPATNTALLHTAKGENEEKFRDGNQLKCCRPYFAAILRFDLSFRFLIEWKCKRHPRVNSFYVLRWHWSTVQMADSFRWRVSLSELMLPLRIPDTLSRSSSIFIHFFVLFRLRALLHSASLMIVPTNSVSSQFPADDVLLFYFVLCLLCSSTVDRSLRVQRYATETFQLESYPPFSDAISDRHCCNGTKR